MNREKSSIKLILSLLLLIGSSVSPGESSFSEVRSQYVESEAYLLDKDGKPIQQIRITTKGRRLSWIPLQETSKALREILLQAEDHRFFQHRGIDHWALLNASVRNLFSKKKRGASTISMQLVSLLENTSSKKYSRKNWFEKWNQMKLAQQLEQTWKKDQILEAYLNLIPFRGELQGIGAATQGLLQKSASAITRAEAVVLVSLIRSPQAKAIDLKKRACRLGETLSPRIECHETEKIVEDVVTKPYHIVERYSLAPHLARHVLIEGIKERSYQTTLSAKLQQVANDAVAKQLRLLESKNVRDGAALIVENRTGNILAYVGSIGPFSRASEVDGIVAPRQAGSTLKPFLYATALDKKLLTAASILLDAPTEIQVSGGMYRPLNYDRIFRGDVSVRHALGSSLNVPAVKTLQLVGGDTFLSKLRDLGFKNLRTAEDYGMSIALGSADITLWDLVNAYRALANGGVASPMQFASVQEVHPPKQVFSKEAAFLVSDILSDPEARRMTFGPSSILSLRHWAAAKTGTSKDMRDNWCIGYDQNYTVGVWIGNFDGEPMWNVSGISGAAPAWAEIMDSLPKSKQNNPAAPSSLVWVDKEWFLAGTEPAPLNQSEQALRSPSIRYPTNHLIIAQDPDIPEELERVFFEAYPERSGYRWSLNGVPLGTADAPFAWAPGKTGSYTLALLDSKNHEVDRVTFTVRASAKK